MAWRNKTWTNHTLAACARWACDNLPRDQWIRFVWYVNARTVEDERARA